MIAVNKSFSELAAPGDIGFYTDFQNVAAIPPVTIWSPELTQGVVESTGLTELIDYIAPVEPRAIAPGGTYSYRYYPASETIHKKTSLNEVARGIGGDFPFIGEQGELKTATMKNYGVSILTENRLAELDPSYERRAVQRAYSLLESAIAAEAASALEDIAVSGGTGNGFCPGSNDLAGAPFTLWPLKTYSGTLTGVIPNRCIVGENQFYAMLAAYVSKVPEIAVSPRFASIEAYVKSAGLEYIPVQAKYQASATSFPTFFNDTILVFNGRDVGFSNLKRFTDGRGIEVRSYDHPQGQMRIHTVSTWFDIAVVCASGVVSWTV